MSSFIFFFFNLGKLNSLKHTHTHTHFPGLVKSADSRRVKTHDDSKCRVQISLSFTTTNKNILLKDIMQRYLGLLHEFYV